ncbi:MAG: hypothetical protein JW915_22415 [Chitinispirillaceae bacterium]|nr:hypothetical protein [Chitinispirillaceae bacterium]
MAAKYGLDWHVWGNTSKKSGNKGFDPSATIGRGWGDSPKNLSDKVDCSEAEHVSQPSPISCRLKNARFHPDGTTDFNRPCKITVEVEGTPKGAIHFALWAKYNDTEHDLNHVQSAFVQNGKAQAELELYYVDEYYTDFYQNGKTEAKVEFFAKISNNAAREIKSELFTMPIAAPVSKFIELYFADKHGVKVKKVDHGDTVFLILKTNGMIGQIVDINIEDSKFIFKSKKNTIKNSIIEDYQITDNIEKIKLRVI